MYAVEDEASPSSGLRAIGLLQVWSRIGDECTNLRCRGYGGAGVVRGLLVRL